MEYGYSVLMFCFAGMLLLCAGLVSVCGVGIIPHIRKARIRNERAYARYFAKVMCIVALFPVPSALLGLVLDINRHPYLIMLAFVGGLAGAIYAAVKVLGEPGGTGAKESSGRRG